MAQRPDNQPIKTEGSEHTLEKSSETKAVTVISTASKRAANLEKARQVKTEKKQKRASAIPPKGFGKEKGSTSKGGTVSRSKRAKTIFPVARIHRFLKKMYGHGIGSYVPVYCAGAMDIILKRVVNLTMRQMINSHRRTITPKYISAAIDRDPEFSNVAQSVIICHGMVLNN